MTNKKIQKIRDGIVISNKMDKTVVVLVQRRFRHPLYVKLVTRTKKYKVHDEQNVLNIGDQVKIVECRPISKDKRFRLLKIIKKAANIV